MPIKLEKRPDGEIVVVTGRTRSGKTLWTMREVARSSRLMIWDSHRQWYVHGCQAVRTIPELARACSTREPAHLAYIGPVTPQTFDQFCRIALCWSKLASCSIVVEELADVTTPAKAPPAWGELLRWVGKLGTRVYALTQRPSESDKTVLGNAARIICHAMGREADARYMAAELRVDLAAVDSLNHERCEHIERLPNFKTKRGFTRKPGGSRG